MKRTLLTSLSFIFILSAIADGINENDIILPSREALTHTSVSDGSGSQFYGTGTDMYIQSGTYGQKVNNSWDGAIQGSAGKTVYIGDYTKIGDTSNVFLKSGSKLYELNLAGGNAVIYGGDFSKGHVVGRAQTSDASITIYGGKFRDITGGNWVGNSPTTGNVNIKMYSGSVSASKTFGLYGGGMLVGDDLNGNVDILLSSFTKTDGSKTSAESTYIIGGSARGASVSGYTNIILEDGARTWGIIGGSGDLEYQKNGGTVGNSNITIDGGVVNSEKIGSLTSPMLSGIIGGGMNKSGVVGNTNITVKGSSTVKAPIIGGNIGILTSSVGGSSNINIQGGNVNITGSTSIAEGNQTLSMTNAIYGGSATFGIYKSGFLGFGSVKENGSSTIEGGSNITVSGGNITGNIFGGGYANGGNSSYTATSIVNNGSKITVDVSENKVSIAGDIYGGGYAENSYATSTVNGGTTITFKGNGENLEFKGTIFAGGAGSGNSIVNGNKVFNFGDIETGFNGKFDANISGFDSINVSSNSNVVWQNFSQNTIVMANSVKPSINNSGNMTLVLDTTVAKGTTFDFVASNVNKLTIGGGSYSNGVITFGGTETTTMGDTTTQITVGSGATDVSSVEVKNEVGNTEVLMSFDTTNLEEKEITVNSISDVKSEVKTEEISNIEEVLAAYSFDVSGSNGGEIDTTVVLSFYLGDSYDGVSTLGVWHRKDESQLWQLLKGDVVFDGENAIFTTTHFSDYMIGTLASVPEPAEWAAIFGAVALGFVMYRRRK